MHIHTFLWKSTHHMTVWALALAVYSLTAFAPLPSLATPSGTPVGSRVVDQVAPKNAAKQHTVGLENMVGLKELEKTLATPIPNIFTAEAENDALRLAKTLSPKAQGLGSWQAMLPALQRSKQYVASKTAGQVALAHGYFTVTWGDLGKTLDSLIKLLPKLDANPKLLAEHFVWARFDIKPFFSGYYEPIFSARLKQQGEYQYPLYRRPKDLQELHLTRFDPKFIGQRIVYRMENGKPVPYYDREAIDKHAALKGQNLELAWLKDSFDVFTLQLQGSGLLRLQDGSLMSVVYAGKNGLPYMSVGQHLSDQGYIPADRVSMQNIRTWMSENPREAETTLNRNRNYVFFQTSKRTEKAPVGSMNVALTPYVSLAVDTTIFPFGSLVAFKTTVPTVGGANAAPKLTGKSEIFGLGLAQDTGTAMVGSRVDIFCGTGNKAGAVAGSLRSEGEMWLLLLKED